MNNKGWGLAQMLILSSILIIALLIAAINTKRLEKNLEHDNTNTTVESSSNQTNSKEDTNTNSSINNEENNTDEKTDTITNQEYTTIEGLMIKNTEYLVNKGEIVVGNDIIIVKDEHLYEIDIELKQSMEKYNCKGYIKVYSENTIPHYTPYLKCDNYKTDGYESTYE